MEWQEYSTTFENKCQLVDKLEILTITKDQFYYNNNRRFILVIKVRRTKHFYDRCHVGLFYNLKYLVYR